MFEILMKLYIMAMAGDVRSPTPHLFGPPGCGKSTVCEQLAKMMGVNLHVINVSRISPLELEGVQMPVAGEDGQLNAKLKLLIATLWTNLKPGDIVLFDEFLRGFPEVFNGLLDIFTSRKVELFDLPKVFFVAASNSTVTYDKALEDRLLHIPAIDPRVKKPERTRLAQIIVDQIGLLPEMVKSAEMQAVLDKEVLPMFELLDLLEQGKPSASVHLKGRSVRNLIGQAKLRHVQSPDLAELLQMNNVRAVQAAKWQYVVLADGKHADQKYKAIAPDLVGNEKLTPLQALNLNLNLQLIGLEEARIETEEGTDDEDDLFA